MEVALTRETAVGFGEELVGLALRAHRAAVRADEEFERALGLCERLAVEVRAWSESLDRWGGGPGPFVCSPQGLHQLAEAFESTAEEAWGNIHTSCNAQDTAWSIDMITIHLESAIESVRYMVECES